MFSGNIGEFFENMKDEHFKVKKDCFIFDRTRAEEGRKASVTMSTISFILGVLALFIIVDSDELVAAAGVALLGYTSHIQFSAILRYHEAKATLKALEGSTAKLEVEGL